MEPRTITEREVEAYRLCHHEFEGLSTAEAAEKMNVTSDQVARLLLHMSRKAPQLFPILTRTQADIYYAVAEEGVRYAAIAKAKGISIQAVKECIAVLKEKGMLVPKEHSQGMIRFEDYMSDQVKEKF